MGCLPLRFTCGGSSGWLLLAPRLRRQFWLLLRSACGGSSGWLLLALRLRRQFRPAALALRLRRQFRLAALALRLRRKAFIFIRKTLQVRPRDQQCICIAKLAEKDLRFSMKMMFSSLLKLRCSHPGPQRRIPKLPCSQPKLHLSYPLTAPAATPPTMYLESSRYTIMTGKMENAMAA